MTGSLMIRTGPSTLTCSLLNRAIDPDRFIAVPDRAADPDQFIGKPDRVVKPDQFTVIRTGLSIYYDRVVSTSMWTE